MLPQFMASNINNVNVGGGIQGNPLMTAAFTPRIGLSNTVFLSGQAGSQGDHGSSTQQKTPQQSEKKWCCQKIITITYTSITYL